MDETIVDSFVRISEQFTPHHTVSVLQSAVTERHNAATDDSFVCSWKYEGEIKENNDHFISIEI